MLAVSVVALALSAAAAAGPALQVKLEGAPNINGVGNAIIKATLTNTGDEVAKVLNDPNTILSKMETNTFAISNFAGATPKFVGKLVKYVPKVDGEATTLAPGQSITVEHQLSPAYDFRRTGPGNYSIETSSLFTLVTPNGLETVHAQTVAHEASLQGELYKPEAELAKRASFTSCSSSQQSSINAAAPVAQSYVSNALSYLNSGATGARYTTWFGTYTSSRYSTVKTHYSNLNSRSYSGYTYDCSCTDSGTYAYTYADQTGKMWFCGAYWSAPTSGTDSKGGTMVHESTHWSAIAGTGDYAYGQSAAKSLALSNPANAIMNADSHEYFAENTPAQS